MQYSKFVNTKTSQKGSAKKDTAQFPIFERSKSHNQFEKPPRVELERLAQEQAKTVEMPKPVLEPPIEQYQEPVEELVPLLQEAESAELEAKEAKIHGSINFQEMQKMEDLNKADEDWLAFFLGKKEPIVYSESTELATVPSSSFAECDNNHAPIIPPAPTTFESGSVPNNRNNSEGCLNTIFDEMISDDRVFSREAKG